MAFTINSQFKLSDEQRDQRKLQEASFPNQISVGSFTPHSTIVEVAEFRADVVQAAIQSANLLNVRKDVQVLCHELTHWFDFFGTVWGREYSAKICRAYRAMERHHESEFPTIVDLFDQDRKILTPTYYRFANSPDEEFGEGRPWRIGFTCGVEIDPAGHSDERKPIYLVNYGTAGVAAPFARQPLSTGALLEVRAIASEINAGLAAIDTETDEGIRLVERQILHREFGKLAYSHELIEYNTAIHVLSHRANTPNMYVSTRLASRLAYIALNMQEGDFRRLKTPSDFSVFGKRNKAFTKNMDRGYAFACLVWFGGALDGDEDAYVDRCLVRSGLGSEADLLSRAVDLLKEPQYFNRPSTTTGHFFRESMMAPTICEILSAQRSRMIDLRMIYNDLKFICPPFMNSEGEFVEMNPGRLNEYDPEGMHKAAHKLRTYTTNLMTGCRGFNA